MFSSISPRLIEQIDQILDGGHLDEETTDRLCELLSPGGNGTGFDVRAVLHAAEHPVVADAAEEHQLPEPLQQAFAEAIGAVSSMLGEWSGAPLDVQVDRLKRRFEREQKKYQMVRDRLDREGLEAGAKILGRYLDTSPAPMFSQQLAADFSGMYQQARDQKGAAREILAGDERLIELLKFDEPTDEPDLEELQRRLDDVAKQLADLEAAVDRALVEPHTDTGLVAAALAVRDGLTDQSHNLLTSVVRGENNSAQTAAFGAWLAPSLARHVLGRFLVDILNDSTPTEDLEAHEDAVRRAIVAARTVLPLIGSPLDEIDQVDNNAEATAGRARRAWEFCTGCYGEPNEQR